MKKMMTAMLVLLVLVSMFAVSASAEAKKGSKSKKNEVVETVKSDVFEGSVKVEMKTKAKDLRYGEEVTLKAVVKGGKNVNYTLRWEVNDGNGWTVVENENGKTLSFTLTEEAAMNQYRAVVVTAA